jgi:hypothetical protein
MPACTICGVPVAGSYRRDGDAIFCSLACMTKNATGEFCERCLADTIDASPGGMFTFNLVGTNLIGGKERCPDCHSVVQRKVFQFVIPLVPLKRYRVLWVSPVEYRGRELRDL